MANAKVCRAGISESSKEYMALLKQSVAAEPSSAQQEE
jgi:hypothetical protein